MQGYFEKRFSRLPETLAREKQITRYHPAGFFLDARGAFIVG